LVDASGNTQTYTLVKPTASGTLDVLFYGHPYNSPFRDVVHTTVDLTTGESPHAPGMSLWAGDGLNLDPDVMDVVIDPSANFRVRLFDCGYDTAGNRLVAYGVWNHDMGPNAGCTYKVKRQAGDGSWSTAPWEHPAGVVFGYNPEAHYHGGVAVGEDGRLVTSSEAGGVWTVRRWEPNGAGNWSAGQVVETSGDPVVRPVLTPVDGKDVLSLLRVQAYDGYQSYDTDILVHI
jgi:hypothetical protein